MKTYEEFKQDYISYMTENGKEVTEDMTKSAYNDYKKETGEETGEEPIIKEPKKKVTKIQTELQIKIKENLTELIDLRTRKKNGENVTERLKEVSKELALNREAKKRQQRNE